MNAQSAPLDILFSSMVFGLLLLFLGVISAFFFYKRKRYQRKLISCALDLESANFINTVLEASQEVVHKLSYTEFLSDSFDLISEFSINKLKASATALFFKDKEEFVFKVVLSENISEQFFESLRTGVITSAKKITQNIGPSSYKLVLDGGQVDSKGVSNLADSFIYEVNSKNGVEAVIAVAWGSKPISASKQKSILTEIVEMGLRSSPEFEQRLSQESGKLEAIVQSMNDGVLLIDPSYKIVVANRSAEATLGVSSLKNSGVFAVAGIYKQQLPLVEVIAKVFESAETRVLKRTPINSGFYSFTFLPVTFENKVLGVGVLIHNDSEEEKLQQLREDFIAMVVHELRSPLTVIRGSADMITREKANFTQEQVDTFIAQIKSSSEGLLKIVNDLLDSAKIDSGKFTVNKKTGNLTNLLKQEAENYRSFAKTKNIDIVLDLDDGVSEFAFDYEKIVQVMNNLLSNAVKFTSPGEITHLSERGTIKIGSRSLSGVVQVFVSDTGTGIPKDVKEKLFSKFVQARESAVSNVPGTGLGLAISKGIVESHGGKIWVEDNVPRGSVFIFTLPVSKDV